IPLDTIAGYKE
nr:RecName: Full=Alpha-2-HS-glycoprotein; AltName: Full=Fetuin-A [Dama dama]